MFYKIVIYSEFANIQQISGLFFMLPTEVNNESQKYSVLCFNVTRIKDNITNTHLEILKF